MDSPPSGVNRRNKYSSGQIPADRGKHEMHTVLPDIWKDTPLDKIREWKQADLRHRQNCSPAILERIFDPRFPKSKVSKVSKIMETTHVSVSKFGMTVFEASLYRVAAVWFGNVLLIIAILTIIFRTVYRTRKVQRPVKGRRALSRMKFVCGAMATLGVVFGVPPTKNDLLYQL